MTEVVYLALCALGHPRRVQRIPGGVRFRAVPRWVLDGLGEWLETYCGVWEGEERGGMVEIRRK